MRAGAIIAIVLTLAGCGSSGSGVVPSSAASSTPEANLCGHLRQSLELTRDMQDGTVTNAEAVERLDAIQAAFETDAETLKDQGAPKAPLVDQVAVGFGRLKVAVDNAGPSFMASPSVTAALVDLAGDIKAMGPC